MKNIILEVRKDDSMNFGQNLFTWFSVQAQSLVLIGVVGIGIWLIIKREFSKLLAFAVIAIVAIVAVFNPVGIKDVLLNIGNTIIGAG